MAEECRFLPASRRIPKDLLSVCLARPQSEPMLGSCGSVSPVTHLSTFPITKRKKEMKKSKIKCWDACDRCGR